MQLYDVCLLVRALKGKRLELSTPNLVHIYSILVSRYALTQRSKGQRSRSHGYENRQGRTVAGDACCYGRLLLLPAWVGSACRYDCLCFVVSFVFSCILYHVVGFLPFMVNKDSSPTVNSHSIGEQEFSKCSDSRTWLKSRHVLETVNK